MTELPNNTSNVFKFEKKKPELPDHKWRFDQFVVAASYIDEIADEFAKFDTDLYVSPSIMIGDSNQILVEDIARTSELGSQIDWLGGEFCDECVSFSVQNDGSLLRIIKLTPRLQAHADEARHIEARFDSYKAEAFVNYIIGKPGDDKEGILTFLEIGEKERAEIELIHRKFRRKHLKQ